MNPLKINAMFGSVPENVPMENRAQRLTALLGMAMSIVVPLPTQILEDGKVRSYFYENASAIRDVLFKINEVAPFDVDRACEYGHCLFAQRYNLAYKPNAHQLFGTGPYGVVLNDVIPEVSNLGVGAQPVDDAVAFLREAVAV